MQARASAWMRRRWRAQRSSSRRRTSWPSAGTSMPRPRGRRPRGPQRRRRVRGAPVRVLGRDGGLASPRQLARRPDLGRQWSFGRGRQRVLRRAASWGEWGERLGAAGGSVLSALERVPTSGLPPPPPPRCRPSTTAGWVSPSAAGSAALPHAERLVQHCSSRRRAAAAGATRTPLAGPRPSTRRLRRSPAPVRFCRGGRRRGRARGGAVQGWAGQWLALAAAAGMAEQSDRGRPARQPFPPRRPLCQP